MKTAYSAVLLAFFFFLSQGVVLAAETNFNPSDLYQVHTIPGETKTTMSHEEKELNTDSETSNTSEKTDISELTFKAMLEKQAAEKSFWESITHALSSSLESITDTFLAAFVIPAEAGIHKATNAISTSVRSVESTFLSILTNTKSSFSHFAHTTVLFLSQSINNSISSMNQGISRLTKSVGNNSAKVISLASAITGLSLGALYFGRSLFATSFKMGMEGVVSLGDMMLRGVGLVTGSLVSLFTGKTISQGYESSLIKIKELLGRDVGDTKHDIGILGRNLVIGVGGLLLIATVIYGAPALTTVSATTGSLATKVSPDVVLKTQYVLSRTANDCSLMGQCEDAIGLGITVVSNSIFGISPSTPALATVSDDAIKYADDVLKDGKILTKNIASNADEVVPEVSTVSKAIKNTLQSPLTDDEIGIISEKIANGHAFNKHVIGDGSFPNLKTKDEFKAFIKKVLKEPNDFKLGTKGRVAFWDDVSQTITIYDPKHVDLGTSFKPDMNQGKNYFINKFN